MAELLTPPASRQSSESPEALLKQVPDAESCTKLMRSLDHSLERYLQLLDRHQKLQTELAQKLSSGFFSLAHANYTCPPGRRYGADYYDERMKATRKMIIQSPPDLESYNSLDETDDGSEETSQSGESTRIFVIDTTTDKQRDEEPEMDKANEEAASEADTALEDESSPASEPKPSTERPRFSDPIHWYGILVPPSLRSAQKSFTEAIDQYLPELASVVVEMQVVERQVDRLRSER